MGRAVVMLRAWPWAFVRIWVTVRVLPSAPTPIRRVLDAIVAPRFDFQGLAFRRRPGTVFGFRQIQIDKRAIGHRRR
jgi:hypothetical protein